MTGIQASQADVRRAGSWVDGGERSADRRQAGQRPAAGRRSFLGACDLSLDNLRRLLGLADSFAEVSRRAIPRVPALRGKTVATAFFEASTRTRLSFETAAKRLSADVMTFGSAGSSLSKGESLRDTVETLAAMGADLLVVRHASAGVPHQIAGWLHVPVVNAGDGWHEHPSQALLDVYTLATALGQTPADTDLQGSSVAIVGDVRHSRVARSLVAVLATLGANVTLVGPGTLLPVAPESWVGCRISTDLDAVLPEASVVYCLRLQAERGSERDLPTLREYAYRYGMNLDRLAAMPRDGLILHPGPMNIGVEIDRAVAEDPRSLVTTQVANGVAVRMAILYELLGGQDEDLDIPSALEVPGE